MIRKPALPLLAATAALAAGAPAAHANLGSKLGQLSGKVAGLSKAVSGLEDTDRGQNDAIDRVNNRVDTVVKNLAPVLAGVPAVTNAVTALADPVTGLTALNSARPKFVNFTIQNTNIEPHTGAAVNSATPGFRSVTYTGVDAAGFQTYILDFGADVSRRVAITSVATPDRSGSDDMAITPCGANQAATDACNGALPGSASPTTVLLTSPYPNPNGPLSGKLSINVIMLAA